TGFPARPAYPRNLNPTRLEDPPMELATYPLNQRRDAWAWRLVATGASFVLFGVGGLLLRVVVLPLLACLPGDAPTRRRRARAAISRAFHLHVQFMYRTRVLDFAIDGAAAGASRPAGGGEPSLADRRGVPGRADPRRELRGEA